MVGAQEVEISALEHLAVSALPNFGLFGAHKKNILNLPIACEIDEFIVGQEEGPPEPLNLRQISFFSADDVEIPRNLLCGRIEATSTYNDVPIEQFSKGFINGELIHTGREARPQVRVLFNAPTRIETVRVVNRSDEWGLRSLPLEVEGRLRGETKYLYRSKDPVRRARSFSAMAARIVDALPSGADPRQASVAEVNRVLQAGLAGLIRRGEARSGIDWIEAVCSINFHRQNHEMNEDEYTILAYYFVYLMGDASSLHSLHLGMFSRALKRKVHLVRLMEVINELATQYMTVKAPLVLSRHDINASKLLLNKQKYVDAAEVVLGLLKQWGREGMLCYGTLLGAVRSNAFIPHDDDVDMLYVDGSTSYAQALERGLELAKLFEESGYSCWPVPFANNFHVNVDGTSIDLFLCWVEGEKLHLTMEKMKFRSIDKALVVPTGTVQLYGRSFPAPANAEGFLEERYGPTWSKPDPYYEWPWTIKD